MTTVLLMSFTEAKNVYTSVLDQQKRTLNSDNRDNLEFRSSPGWCYMLGSKCEMFDTIGALNSVFSLECVITNKTPYLCHGIPHLFEFL